MKNKIVNVLLEMGMPADMKGFDYIVQYIMLLDDNEWKKCGTTTLYYKIAKDNDVNPNVVERCIRYAFNYVLRNGKQDVVKRYLTNTKTNNGNLLKTFYLRIFMEE